MTSASAAQSNRQNSQKSAGPRSQEGRERSSYIALKHGATSWLLVLPGAQSEELEHQRGAWIASRAGEDLIEQALVQRAFEAWHQLGRTLRAQQAPPSDFGCFERTPWLANAAREMRQAKVGESTASTARRNRPR